MFWKCLDNLCLKSTQASSVFMPLIVLIFRAASPFSFFLSFEQRWVSSYWCEAAIDFYLEAEVKGSLTTSSGLNVYWPIICDMVCIFKCVRMGWDHWRAASFSGWAEIEPRPAVFGGAWGAFIYILDFFFLSLLSDSTYWSESNLKFVFFILSFRN